MTPEQEQKLNEVYEFIQQLKASSTIPYDVDNAFRIRLSDVFQSLAVSSKSASSENQAVDEGGVSTYNVLSNPDGFLEVVLNNTVYYIPYFS